MSKLLEGFTKSAEAKEGPEGHHMRRAALGNIISTTIEARKGSKAKAFRAASGHQFKENLKGTGKGLLAGGAAGLLAGGAHALATKGKDVKGSLTAGVHAGAGLGSTIGLAYGKFKGSHGAEASRIHGMYSKHKPAEKTAAKDYSSLGKPKTESDHPYPASLTGLVAGAAGGHALGEHLGLQHGGAGSALAHLGLMYAGGKHGSRALGLLKNKTEKARHEWDKDFARKMTKK